MIKRDKKRFTPKRCVIAILSLVLVAAIITGICIHHHKSAYACQYATPFLADEVSYSEDVIFIAHRGLATQAPENTLPAYEQAAAHGFRYVETDIHATADGVWVLTHDASLKRMTGYSGNVEKMSFAEVQQHKITKGANIQEYPDLVTPTYEEFIRLCKEKGLIPLIEIKTKPEEYPNAPYRDILSVLEQYGMIQKAIIISFYADVLETLREYNQEIAMQYLVKKIDEQVLTTAEQIGSCGIDCAYSSLLQNFEMVATAKQQHIALNAWTADTIEDVQQLCDIGVDYITTNALRYK